MTSLAPPTEEQTVRGADGTALHLRAWRVPQPRLILINVHGLGDHGALYPDLIEFGLCRGWSVLGPDTRGNGRSGGARGHVERFEHFRQDLQVIVRAAQREAGALPLVLVGHSLGGLIVLDYALAHPTGLSAVVLAAPPLGPLAVSGARLALARSVSRLWPGFALETGLDLSTLADDPAILPKLLSDPLFHRKASARLATEVERTVASVHAGGRSLTVPTLIMHGTGDDIVPIEGSRRFASTAAPAPVELMELPGARHALFADYGKEERLRLLGEWLEQKSKVESLKSKI